MRRLLEQDAPFYERNSAGSLMGKSTNDVSFISELAGFGMLSLFDSTVFPLAILVVMVFVVDLRLTLAAVLPFPLLAYLSILIGRRIYKRWSVAQAAFDHMNERVLEDVEGVRIVRGYNLNDIRRQGFEDKGQELLDANMRVVKYEALLAPVQRIIPALSFVIAIAYGSYLVSISAITIGQLVSFTYYLNMLVWPMYAFGNFINIRQRGMASMDRIQAIWDEKISVPNLGDRRVPKHPHVRFEDYSFAFPTSDLILKDIDLDLPAGKSLGVLGKTGSGKTTLLKQIFQWYPADRQSLYLDGEAILAYKKEEVRDKTGYVPQDYMIFSKTIRENILFSKPDATEEELWHAIRTADLEKDLEDFPLGVDTLSGERGVSLSGGQKQRIQIARAVLKDPEILILDDCLSAVDAQTEQHIIQALREERKGRTTILACHRISQVMDFDEIIVLDHGRISERGNHESLMERRGWYYEQYKIQSARRKYEDETSV